jgi:hypothetical protein
MRENKNRSGLNLPEGYFDTFEDRMMLKIMEESLPKTSGFKTPDGYFGQVEDRVMSRVSESGKAKVIPLFRNKTVLFISGIAASLVLIISLVNVLGSDISIEDLSATTVETYINEGGMDIDSYDVMALLEEEDINNLTITSEVLSEESLENYLIENIDENTLLIE